MNTATLIEQPTPDNMPAWVFDHAMVHRHYLGAMSDPITRVGGGLTAYSGVPYFIDPMRGSGEWHLDHEQAHQDYMLNLPAYFDYSSKGMSPTQNFGEMDFESQSMLTWWTHANHQQHLNAEDAMVAVPLVFPFW